MPEVELREPLRFERHFVEKSWGGRTLERVPGIALPAGPPIGETWEIVDRENENSVVATGAHKGKTLRELMRQHGASILGSAAAGKDGRFPLLVKYIDASKNLSVQVHPNERTAPLVGGTAEPKTEAWYIVDIASDGLLYAGVKASVEREEFARVADSAKVQNALHRLKVARGECLLVNGGTVHAIGAGVTVLEVQQNSDTTFRLYDWGNVGLDGKPRETHVAQALECVEFGQPAPQAIAPSWKPVADGALRATLAASHVFGMHALRITAPARLDTGGAFRIYAVLGGAGALSVEGAEGSWPLATGDVWLIPAVCGIHAALPAGAEELFLVEMTPPA